MKIYRYAPTDITGQKELVNKVDIRENTAASFANALLSDDVIYFFDPEELAYKEAMDDYAKNTTPGGTWICDGTDPCAYDDPSMYCPHHD